MGTRTSRRDPRSIAMLVSLVVAAFMLAGKLAAYLLTNSDAILSDAAESVVHGVATGFAVYSLWLSRRPADRQHPYGHGKIAFFSAGFEGALILTAALVIIYSAVRSLVIGPQVHDLGVGLVITAVLAAVNLVLGVALVRIGRSHNALILVANGKHVLTDMWTSAGVVVGVAVVWATDVVWLDPAVAIAVALNILYSAVRLMRTSFGGLMDEADPATTERIVGCLEAAVNAAQVAGYHQLRHRRVDDQVWIDVHFLIPGQTSTTDAHAGVTFVEESLRAALLPDRVHVTSHVEPTDHGVAHPAGHADTAPLDEGSS